MPHALGRGAQFRIAAVQAHSQDMLAHLTLA